MKKKYYISHIVLLFINKDMKKFDYYIGIDVSKLTLDVTILCCRPPLAPSKNSNVMNEIKLCPALRDAGFAVGDNIYVTVKDNQLVIEPAK
jgi:hypothetical protein